MSNSTEKSHGYRLRALDDLLGMDETVLYGPLSVARARGRGPGARFREGANLRSRSNAIILNFEI